MFPEKLPIPKKKNGKSDMRRVKPAADRLFGKGHK